MGRILAICTSPSKGTPKSEIESANLIENFGVEGDAHAGDWHRQVSLLSFEKIQEFRKRGANVEFGAFGENLVIEGMDFSKFNIGTKLSVGKIILQVTQIGKECHNHCNIYKSVGDCIMPREGVFTRVLSGGTLKSGQEINFIE